MELSLLFYVHCNPAAGSKLVYANCNQWQVWPDSSGVRHLHWYLLCFENTKQEWENKLASIRGYFSWVSIFYKRKKLHGCAACWLRLAVKRKWVLLACFLQCLLLSRHSNNDKTCVSMAQQVMIQFLLWPAVCQSHRLSHSAGWHTDGATGRQLLCAAAIRPRAPLAWNTSGRSPETGWGHASCQSHAAIQPLLPIYLLCTDRLSAIKKITQEHSRLQVCFALGCGIETYCRWYLHERQAHFYFCVYLE